MQNFANFFLREVGIFPQFPDSFIHRIHLAYSIAYRRLLYCNIPQNAVKQQWYFGLIFK